MFRIKDGRKVFYQWDLNTKLIVSIECKEVHFTNDGTDAKVVIPYDLDGERVVNVPNILLWDTKTITAYAYIEDTDGGYTKLQKPFIVIPRAKPEDYVYTETEVLRYSSLDKRITDLEGEGLANFVVEVNGSTANKTNAEIYEAYQSGKAVSCVLNYDGSNLRLSPVVIGNVMAVFSAVVENASIGVSIIDNEVRQSDTVMVKTVNGIAPDGVGNVEIDVSTEVNEALAQAKASGDFKGEKGDKGEPGEPGADGAQGEPGADGYTPVKGTDYFTEADKQEIAELTAQLVDVPEGGGLFQSFTLDEDVTQYFIPLDTTKYRKFTVWVYQPSDAVTLSFGAVIDGLQGATLNEGGTSNITAAFLELVEAATKVYANGGKFMLWGHSRRSNNTSASTLLAAVIQYFATMENGIYVSGSTLASGTQISVRCWE